MPDYSLGKIYRIWSPSTDKVYIGSTVEPLLCRRLTNHRRQYKSFKGGKFHYVTSFAVLEFEDAKIELVESFPCASKDELQKREGEVIRATDNAVNRYIAGRTKVEYANDNIDKIKDYMVTYRAAHEDELKTKRAEYRKANIEHIVARETRYKTEHRGTICARMKLYNAEHREEVHAKRKVRTDCSCGGYFNSYGKARHFKSGRHQAWAAANPA